MLHRSNHPGGSYPLLFDAFNINPASIPSELTPIGVEAFYDRQKFNFSLIKGHGNVGTALTTSSTEGTFFSNASNVDAALVKEQTRINPTADDDLYAPNLNFGLSTDLFSANGIFSSSLGASVRYLRESKEFSQSIGLDLKSRWMNLSGSFTRKTAKTGTMSGTAGLKVDSFLLDYTYIRNLGTTSYTTYILSSTYRIWKLVLTYAIRRQKLDYITQEEKETYEANGIEIRDIHTMLGVNIKFSERFSLGAYTNYTMGRGSSIVMQYFFVQ